MYPKVLSSLAVVVALGFASAPASALTMKECSARYKAAKAGGTLNGMGWSDFRKAQCGSDGAAASTPAGGASAAPETDQATAANTTPAPAVRKSRAKKMPPGATSTTGEGPVFPNAVDQKYASESAGKGRMHTCLDQYRANKDNNGNAGLKWIQKGGGYYAECNKHLKG